jgi:microcystin-dependent protein
MIWSGSVGSVPTGWTLCNGSNSTPDLRDKFVIGAGNSYAVGGTGGSKDSVVVSHTHTATVTDPGHTHSTNFQNTNAPSNGDNFLCGTNGPASGIPSNATLSNTTGITVGVSTTGVSGNNANLPPYYALCYIMKT